MKVRSRAFRRKFVRAGAVTLELILVFPFLVIALMAVVQFGLLFSNQQRLEMASRAGAKVASEMTLPEIDMDPVPAAIQNAINRELSNSGIVADRIIVQHNVGSNPPYTLISGALNCPAPTTPPLPASRQYVRVTVCAGTTKLAPNLLKTYGFDLSGRISQQTTTLRYDQ